jgi:hypothetical protein
MAKKKKESTEVSTAPFDVSTMTPDERKYGRGYQGEGGEPVATSTVISRTPGSDEYTPDEVPEDE